MTELSSHNSGKTARLLLALGGLLVFAALFWADKTHLASKPRAGVEGAATASNATEESSGELKLPPLAPEAATDALIAKLAKTEGKAKVEVLDSLILKLTERQRFDMAAKYAEEKEKLASNLDNQLKAGVLYAKAMQSPVGEADSLLANKLGEKAQVFLNKVLAQDSTQEEALLNLGLTYIHSHKPENSMKGILTIRKVVEKNPNNVEAGFQLGLFSMQTGQVEKAIGRFEQVLKVKPDFVPAQFHLANAYMQTGKKEEAKSLLEKVASQHQDAELSAQSKSLLNNLTN